jgi:hypothetical protein
LNTTFCFFGEWYTVEKLIDVKAKFNFLLYEYKDSAKLCQDYGTFVQGVGTLYSPYILDAGFLAVELNPGAVIVGKDSPFYRSEGVTVHAI